MTCKLHRAITALCMTLTLAMPAAQALDIKFQQVAEGVFMHLGEAGPPTAANQGLNANLGLIVTSAGAVLVDTGATYQSARLIHEAIRKVTNQPLKRVINTGSQGHRWLGNGYFAEQEIETVAHAGARLDMESRGAQQVTALQSALKSAADGTAPKLPKRFITTGDMRFEMGGTIIELKHRGGALTPGDMLVWLPQKRIVFAGDVVHMGRMPALLPVTNTRNWLASFDVVSQLNPTLIVPGHGRAGNLSAARSGNEAYLRALRVHMRSAVDNGKDADAAVKSFEATPFMRLQDAATVQAANAAFVYREMQRE